MGYWVALVVPKALPWAESLRIYAQHIFEVPGSYMDRNDELQFRSDRLIAFPRTAKEERRSGTWATIRRFRKAGKPVLIVPLSDA